LILETEISALIDLWDERLRRVDENLIALEGEPAYQMLSAGARAKLTGDTRARVVPALDALGELFEHRERLNGVLARAKELRGQLSFWGKEEKLAEISELLSGRSITLGTKQMPVAQRNLLDSAASDLVVAPTELLGEMVRGYQIARDAVAAVGAAWARLEPQLVELERQVGEVQAAAADVGQAGAVRGEVDAIAVELSRVRALVATDPLGVAGDVDANLGPRLAALTGELTALREQKARVTQGLARGDVLLAKIEEAERAAAVALARGGREIAGFGADPGGSARREVALGLDAWREKILAAAQAGRWKAADVGLTRWTEAAEGVALGALDVVRKVEAAEGVRVELEGRLSARRAQASALVARGQKAPPDMDTLARSAEAILRARPTDLGKAETAVEAYEVAVQALRR
jgi:hypothetical protein